MSNPYSPPDAQEYHDSAVFLPDGVPFVVVADDVYCRSDVDFSDHCYMTGDESVVTTKTISIPCLPRRWTETASVILYLMGAALFCLGFIGHTATILFFPWVWCAICFAMLIFSTFLDRVKLTYGLSALGKRLRRRRFLRRIFVFSSVMASIFCVAGLASTFRLVANNFDVGSVTLGLSLMLGMIIAKEDKRLKISRAEGGLFRVQNLPNDLLTKIRDDHSREGSS